MDAQIKLSYRHGRGKFDYVPPLYVMSDPETIYIDNSGDIRLGKGVNIARGVSIITHQHLHNRDVPIGEAPVLCTSLTVGDDVFIGANAIILPQVHFIAKGTVIGAGSVVTKEINGEYQMWAGNPAKFIKMRP